jgi:hypothetical protein
MRPSSDPSYLIRLRVRDQPPSTGPHFSGKPVSEDGNIETTILLGVELISWSVKQEQLMSSGHYRFSGTQDIDLMSFTFFPEV